MDLKKDKFNIRLLKSWIKNHQHKILFGVYLFAFVATIIFFMGYVERYESSKPYSETFDWLLSSPFAFIINCLILLLLTIFIWLLSKSLKLSVIVVSVFALLFSLVNYFKLTIRAEPIYPSDLLFSGEASNIVGATKLVVPPSIVVFGAVTLFFVFLTFFIKKKKLTVKKRYIGIFVIIVFWVVSFPLYFANPNIQGKLGTVDAIWNQKYNYLKNGPLNAFLMQTKYLVVDKPSGYSKKNAENLLNQSTELDVIASTPNVIVVMSESFWDPTRLTNVTYNVDPMESFKEVQKESIYGDILVEPFGGNTANTEFEALTGLSMHSLPGGVAYQQYVKRELPSLASLLKSQGYTTRAIHPYEDWFWNRTVVYPLLGIDEFITKTSFSSADYRGNYVSDKALMNKVIAEYKESEPSGKPFFAHIVSMQNHGWHEPGRYGDDQIIQSSSDKLSEAMSGILDTYAQGVKDAADGLLSLVEYFMTVDEPTEIIFFGDHLPTLVGDYGLYRSTGYVSEGDLTNDDVFRLHTTPFIIWNNYNSKKQNVGTVNANYLAPIMLKSADITMNSYFSYLDKRMNGAKACNKVVCLADNGKYIDRTENAIKQKLNNQAIIQYYYLFD